MLLNRDTIGIAGDFIPDISLNNLVINIKSHNLIHHHPVKLEDHYN